MSDRPTPETDAKASPHIGFHSCATVPANFARDLERERDEARAELSLKQQTLTIAKGTLCDLRKELEDVRAQRDEARKFYKKT